jgi:hypothetical protein
MSSNIDDAAAPIWLELYSLGMAESPPNAGIAKKKK